jgi:protein-tyrosine kinase
MLSTKVRNADRPIGAILQEAGLLSADAIEKILQYQKQSHLRFGEAGVELGLLNKANVLYALSLQFDYPYLQANGANGISEEVVAAYEPFGVEGERLRALRSQLQLNWRNVGSRPTALAVVSCSRGDGRSRLAANLAVTFAQLGQRALLIDADLRMPRQHALFRVDNQVGLSSLLAGRMQDQVVNFVHGIPGLAVLPSGPTPPNPTELLSRPAFYRILEQSASSFDVVIVDTPAFDAGADVAMIARATGAALAVARHHTTRAADFRRLIDSLLEGSVSVVGSTLVEVTKDRKRRNAKP